MTKGGRISRIKVDSYILCIFYLGSKNKSLTQLDLSHNYLRAVTSDLVDGLPSLESLDLTDNDISLVESGALTNLPKLIHLSLTGKSIAN
jgi:Leucine-rich repeat (LRR) protein